MAEKKNYLKILTNGIIKENPTLCLVLGTCPTLAITTAASNAIGMGIAATLVLVCSNAVISILRKVIPATVRIPAYITIIAGFVSIVQMLVKAYLPEIDASLGIYLPLIVVNCIILGRAEMYASKNSVLPSILDGLGMGIGFTAALLCMGIIREFFGAGTLFDIPLLSATGVYQPILVLIMPAGGFFVFGLLIAIATRLSKGKPKKPEEVGCASCPMAKECAGKEGGCENA